MDFLVKFNDFNVENTKQQFIESVKKFASYSRDEQRERNIDRADEFYKVACGYVWSAYEFEMIPLQTAFDLIDQIAYFRYH